MKQPLIAVIESGARQPTAAAWDALEGALDVRLSQVLRVARDRVLAMVDASGGRDVRVFGSVAHGTDQPDSDIDLVAHHYDKVDDDRFWEALNVRIPDHIKT